jgi:hypothetical protein
MCVDSYFVEFPVAVMRSWVEKRTAPFRQEPESSIGKLRASKSGCASRPAGRAS